MSMRSTCFDIGFHLMNVTRESGIKIHFVRVTANVYFNLKYMNPYGS